MAQAGLDSVRLQIAWSRLLSIVDEATSVLVRTAISTNIREAMDVAIVLFDEQGRALAQSTVCIPSFIGTLPRTLAAFLARIPVGDWQPGDVIVTNDPWLGTVQLNDLSMAVPVFRRGLVVGFVGLVAHLPDIGGIGAGTSASDTFEEGLHIPVCKLHRGGRPDVLAFSFIAENVRLPDAVRSDIQAMVAAAEECVRRTVALMEWLGIERMSSLGDPILEASDHAMRRAISALRPGHHVGDAAIEGVSFDLALRVRLAIDRDRIDVDFDGTSAQADRAINSTIAHTTAHTIFALKCLLTPDIPNNDGSSRALTVSAPSGSILASSPPAAGWARTHVSHYISSLIFKVMGDALPERTLAEGGSPRPVLTFRGQTESGIAYSATYRVMAGMGAGAGMDGLSAMAFPTNTRTTPIEWMERTAPLRFVEKALRPGSGGPGRWRGGLGQRVSVEITSDEPVRIFISPGRTRFAAHGVAGGDAAVTGAVALNGADAAWSSETVVARRGDVLSVLSSGGGGNGPVRDRDPIALGRDLEEGLT